MAKANDKKGGVNGKKGGGNGYGNGKKGGHRKGGLKVDEEREEREGDKNELFKKN